jgi:multiple sugar transport system permease protein
MNKQLKIGWFEKNTKWLLLVPTVFLLLALTVYPLIYAFIAMLHKINIRTGERTFIGFQNFIEMSTDPFFWNALKNTAIYTSTAVAVLTPMMLPPIVAAVIFKIIYIPDFGIINWFLSLIGIEGIVWEASANTALISLILVDIWEWTPFMFLILLAGLQAIPLDPYEAAEVDGATKFQIFRDITFPLLRPAVLIALLLRIMDTLRIFDQIFIMTGGGPANATETMSLYIYRHGFRFSNIGYATAMSFIMLILTLLISNYFISRLKTEEVF